MPGSLDLANYQWPERSQTMEENPLLLVFQTSIIYNYFKNIFPFPQTKCSLHSSPKQKFISAADGDHCRNPHLVKMQRKTDYGLLSQLLLYCCDRIPYRIKTFICAFSSRDLESMNIMVECMVAGRHDTGAVLENLTS